MIVSYDYSTAIAALLKEINTGHLLRSDTIQVLRSPSKTSNDYLPIIGWYYNHDTMMGILAPDDLDEEKDGRRKIRVKREYTDDLPFLQVMLVADFLDEMEKATEINKQEMDAIFKEVLGS